MEFQKVEVIWFDAQSGIGAIPIEEVRTLKPVDTRSIGYLVHKDNHHIVLAFTLFDDNDELIKHFQVIPRNMIKMIIPLKAEKK